MSNDGWHRAVLSLCVTLFLCACSAQPSGSGINLSILTLNLHTYQELRAEESAESELTDELARQRIEAYGPILDQMAAGIIELDPDIICFQEVGEWAGVEPGNPDSIVFGASESNMARQLLSRLGDRYGHYTMDWSHFGWDVWLEGSAILSKYPMSTTDSRFITSLENGKYDSWKSRNVPMARVDVPRVGSVDVYSVHAGWWDDPDEPFQEQYRRLLDWTEESTPQAPTTILCGDFNIPAGGTTYSFLTEDTGFADQYLLANPDGMFDGTIGGGADGWEDTDNGQRIDYILMNEDSPLAVTRSRRVFTEKEFGHVSDHVGIYAEFGIAQDR